ncbi:unnamed protein product, partial [Nesidiocoris tenuis]
VVVLHYSRWDQDPGAYPCRLRPFEPLPPATFTIIEESTPTDGVRLLDGDKMFPKLINETTY